ncbi:methyltransferase [Spongiibacter sp.]|uniref:methyltransferase n=1 Tax=Spongiibacter sp. TaxID=2024860 RepID=UPI0035687C0B
MNDAPLQQLYRQLAQLDGPLWWFADEQVNDDLPALREDCQVFCNRCDTAAALREVGFAVSLGDFAVPQKLDVAPQAVVYRVSKERPLVHLLINAAMQALPVGGQLLLSGYKNDGLKGYADKIAKVFDAERKIKKCDAGAYLATITKRGERNVALPDKNYRQLRLISESPALYSKPGIYGWQKIDRGSALLIEQLPRFLQGLSSPPQRAADIGCGYGYLAVMAAAELPDCEWLLTDNNATALLACEKNSAEHGLRAELHLADCADGLQGPVDIVLCNPPFHQGFAVEGELTERFLQAAHRLLKRNGQALFVVNQFIPLQRKAEGLFPAVELLGEAEGFRVFRLAKQAAS